MNEFRDLKADEIECRVAMVKPNGLQLLLYKNARVDMAILDETVGVENWQREHYECKGNLFCRVGIKCGNEWIWKADCGAESYTEKEKGEASDSFKRACTNWGIGRELYTYPFIWVTSSQCKITDKKCYDRFVVSKIVIKGKKIVDLEIKNTSTNNTVYWMCGGTKEPVPKVETDESKDMEIIKAQINSTLKELAKKKGVPAMDIYKKAMADLKVTGKDATELTRINVLLTKWINE